MVGGGQMDRYLAATFLKSVGTVLICLLVLVTLFTVVDEVSDVTPGYTEAHALLYIVYSTPRRLYELVPFGVFIGALVGLGMLASHSELTILRGAGVSLARLFAGTALPALGVLVLNQALGEFVAPAGETAASTLKLRIQRANDAGGIESTSWHREGGVTTSIDGYGSNGELIGVRQYVVVDGRLQKSRRADTAVYVPEGRYWRLEQVVETVFDGPRLEVRNTDSMEWYSDADATLLSAKALFDPAKLSFRDLVFRIRYLEREGLDAKRYQIAFWAKALQPAAVLGLVLLALACVVGPLRESGLGVRLAVGIAIGLAFKYLIDVFGPISVVFAIPPWLAMLVPVVGCWLAGLVLIRRA